MEITKVVNKPYAPDKTKHFEFSGGYYLTIDYNTHEVLDYNQLHIDVVERVNMYLTKPIRIWANGKVRNLTVKNYNRLISL